MANKLYEENHIQEIADAIREKNGSTDTYTVSQMGEAIRTIPSGGGSQALISKEFTGTITDTTVGSGMFKTLVTDPDLATHRNDETFWCRVVLDIESTPYTVVENLAFNGMNVLSDVPYQNTRRWDASGNVSRSCNTNPINIDNPSGVGCVQITSDGELRIYANSNNYAIRPCNYKVVVGW